jgi:hypothetical protein
MPPLDLSQERRPAGLNIPPEAWQKIEQQRRQEQARAVQYGDIRPILHIPEFGGNRLVGVRNRIYYSNKWKFFADFLFDYTASRFGKDWLDTQNSAAPADRHPLYVLRKQAYEFMKDQKPSPDGTYVATPNGPMAMCNNFYYDLYTVDDNSMLDESLLERLKHRDQFQGALHELFVEATCLRAGFTILRENEKDRTRKHVEFMAVHKTTGQHVLVEAKSRHRAGVLGRPGMPSELPDIKFRRLINDAINKDPNNPLAIFVDTNLPPDRAERFYALRSRDPITPSAPMSALMESVRRDHGGIDPYNVLVFSNHPQHYSSDDSIAPGNRWAGFISTKKARVPVVHERALFDLIRSVNLYSNVPNHFPSEGNQA